MFLTLTRGGVYLWLRWHVSAVEVRIQISQTRMMPVRAFLTPVRSVIGSQPLQTCIA